jgi:hypothetical protein
MHDHKKRATNVYIDLADANAEDLEIAEPFGDTITHHRMPPNTAAARVALWLKTNAYKPNACEIYVCKRCTPIRCTPLRNARL